MIQDFKSLLNNYVCLFLQILEFIFMVSNLLIKDGKFFWLREFIGFKINRFLRCKRNCFQ